jgi:hypothetical protein
VKGPAKQNFHLQNHPRIRFPITSSQFFLRSPNHHKLPSLPITPHSASHCLRVLDLALDKNFLSYISSSRGNKKIKKESIKEVEKSTHRTSQNLNILPNVLLSVWRIVWNPMLSTVDWFNNAICTFVTSSVKQNNAKRPDLHRVSGIEMYATELV